MHSFEAPIYHAVIVCGSIILFFTCIYIGSSVWLQRSFRQKRKKRMEEEIIRIENERCRIAADLHDEAGPIIYSIRRRIEDARAADEESMLLLKEGNEKLLLLGRQLEAISKGLIPLSLEKKGLLYSLNELVLERTVESDLKIELLYDHLPALEKTAEVHIYRIVLEIISNTIKHAGADLLVIDMHYSHRQLILRTADNGKGFDVTRQYPGLGMGNIHYRAMFLNGTAFVDGTHGCRWEIKLQC
ncbi:MAG: hypothetical protein QM687_17265 [Ferruginibacter sp.]